MNHRVVKKILSFVLMLIVGCGSAAAADIQPRWSYILTIGGDIDISSFGTATVYGNGTARSTDVNKLAITLDLQQYTNGKWETKKSWSQTSQLFSINTADYSWAVAHGYSYRLYITLKAYNGNRLLETGTGIINYGYFK